MRLTDQQRRDRELSEDEFRQQIHDLAGILGWSWMFVKPLRAAGGIWKTPTFGPLGKGWPDDTLVHPVKRRIVFAEVKKELGKVEPDQERVHAFLRRAGFEVYVWRPSDIASIQEVLAR
ncbi:MAG: VRR-NUC domain-containing protein [Chloroflexi bacterium]|nr:VRR-NUC domain-containing protein [Chloroflexota bacterium]